MTADFEVVNHGAMWIQDFRKFHDKRYQHVVTGRGKTLLEALTDAVDEAVRVGEVPSRDNNGTLSPAYVTLIRNVAWFVSGRSDLELALSCHGRCVEDDDPAETGPCDWRDGRCDKQHFVSLCWGFR